MIEVFKKTNTTFSKIQYHLVFCPRYRKKIFLIDGVAARFKELISQICEAKEYDLIELECNTDCCYITVEVLPTTSAHDVMKAIKAATSNTLMEEFPKLSGMQAVWTRNYLVSTEKLSFEVISEYVKMQKNHP